MAAPEHVTGEDIVRATAKRQLRLLPLVGVMFFTV